MARPVAYGCVNEQVDNIEIWADASQPWQANGGKWVHVGENASRCAVIASATNKDATDIIGWAEVGTYSSSSTIGQDKITVNIHPAARFEMPMNYTQTEQQLRQLIGKTCDIQVAGEIQYINPSTSADQSMHIMGYKYYGEETGEQSLLVKRYAGTVSATEVA